MLTKADEFEKGVTYRVRCVVDRLGDIAIQAISLPVQEARCWRVDFAKTPVNSTDVMLFHKTTARDCYTTRLAEQPHCDEVILVNERGEVTECTIGNLVVETDGKLLTPPIGSGLLAGTFRDELLARGTIDECVLTATDVKQADALFMINSVREWVPLTWAD